MNKISSGEWPLSEVHHLGAIVRDADKTAGYFESLGMGSFEPLGVEGYDERIGGELLTDLKLNIRMGEIGSIRLEMIEPVEGKKSIWKEFLERKGEGIHHLAYMVDDIDKARDELVRRGLNLIFTVKFRSGGGGAYFETDGIGGLVLELFQPPNG
jgi:methylmalonyl-CoA/ethylmalonyl-CoA epimerase